MQKEKKCVFILYSIYNVMKAEKLLKEENIGVDLIPVPRKISSDCGMAVELENDNKDKTRDILTVNNIEIAGIYLREGKFFQKVEEDHV